MPKDRFVFAHLADAHVGAWPRQPRFRSALRDSVLKAIARAEKSEVEFLLISGDLFHTPTPDPAEVAPIAAALRRLVDLGTRIYTIYGSHDYVAHRTSWLDVLAEAGVFARVAPEAVRAEGTRWTLPFLVDHETGARIAGVSGRAHGFDREYFRGMDSEAFRAEPGYHIFQFHAAVEEYLPEGMREHIAGIRRADLPDACDYYAGGHIHRAYLGEGPSGGLLVNPGALFGTSRVDLEQHPYAQGRQGLALVSVDRGRSSLEFYDPFPEAHVAQVQIEVTDRRPEEVHEEVRAEIARHREGSYPVLFHFTGVAKGGSLAEFGLGEIAREAGEGTDRFAADVEDVDPGDSEVSPAASEAEVEVAEFERLRTTTMDDLPWLKGEEGIRRMRALLQELGTARAEGEAVGDYRQSRRRGAFKVLDVRGIDPEE